MIRFLLAAVLLVPVGCGPVPPPSPMPLEIRTLVQDYRSIPRTAESAYRGRAFRFNLRAGIYECRADGIHYYPERTTVPPTVVFLCVPPADNTGDIVVEGMCRGAQFDDVERGNGTRFTVTFGECLVSRR